MRNIFRRSAIPLLITYGCLAVLSVAMFVLARNFPGSHMGAAAPGFFPQLVAGLLLLLCLLGVLELGRESLNIVDMPLPVLGAMAFALGYIGLMYYVGYYPSTFIFVFALMTLLRGEASWVRVGFDSIAITACSYLFFQVMIDAHLPAGILFG
jgi:hypothetical protein